MAAGGSGGGAGGALQLDLYKEIRRLTLTIILRVTFGLGEAGRDFKDAEALSSTIGAYLEAIVATANEVPPLWSLAPSLSPNYRKVTNELLPRLRGLVADVIAQRRARDDGGGLESSTDRADLLSVLVRDGGLSDEDIQFVLFDLVIAGSDTTASTITAALFLLHEPEHADALAAARREVGGVDILSLSLDEVREKLPYCTAVAREVLRLYPPVPFVGRTAVAPRTIGGLDVPEGGALCSRRRGRARPRQLGERRGGLCAGAGRRPDHGGALDAQLAALWRRPARLPRHAPRAHRGGHRRGAPRPALRLRLRRPRGRPQVQVRPDAQPRGDHALHRDAAR